MPLVDPVIYSVQINKVITLLVVVLTLAACGGTTAEAPEVSIGEQATVDAGITESLKEKPEPTAILIPKPTATPIQIPAFTYVLPTSTPLPKRTAIPTPVPTPTPIAFNSTGSVTSISVPTLIATPLPTPTPVLEVHLIPSLIENNIQSSTNDIWDSNWIWLEQSWDASSTGRISKTLLRQDDNIIVILETNNCIRNSNTNSLGDDCDRSIRRSQIRNHQSFQINKELIYTFTVSKILTQGNSDSGNYINFFEIKPWTDGITFTVPTLSLYVNPQTNQMNVIQSLGNHAIDPNTQNDIVQPLGKLLEGWNNFQIHIKHSANSDGYLRIYQNERIIYDYKGKTSYKHNRPIKYWIGPYICCGKIDSLPNEPNHIFVYKNVVAVEKDLKD